MHRNQHNYDKMKLEIQKILLAFALPLLLLFILYTLRTMESVMNWDFITWGIYPKETKGIMGILTSPLIHADWGHLFANTFPLLFLLWCLLYFYRDIIRKTKCFDFWERNVLFPKTKRSFFRTPKHPLPCPFPLNFSLLIITKKFGNLAKNRYICIV